MKTGGTMNFLQRAGAILMLLAIFASSCNKYADDFTQINTKLDALATQVAGVTTLSTDIAALKSQVTALQTSIAALPTATVQAGQFTAVTTALTAMDAKITALTTTLNTVATAGTATKAVVDGLKTDLATLAATVATNNTTAVAAATAAMAKLTTNETAVAALKTQLTALAAADALVAADITAIKAGVAVNTTAIAANADALTALAAKITTLAADLATFATASGAADADAAAAAITSAAATATSLADISTALAALATSQDGSNAATAAAIAALQVSVTAQKTQLDIIVASTAMYNGDVNLTNQAELDFFTGKIAVLGIINGNLTINTTGFTAAQMTQCNAITSKITATIGTGNFTLTQAATGLDLTKLASVKGNYIQVGAIGEIPALAVVGGSFVLDYKGTYSNSVLTSVGGDLALAAYNGGSGSRTLGVNFPNAVIGGYLNSVQPNVVAGVYTPLGVAGPSSYLYATTFVGGGKFTTLTTDVATSIKILSTTFAGSTTINVGTTPAAIDLSMITKMTAAGTLTITSPAGSTLDLSNFATGKSTDAPAADRNVTTTGVDVLTLPKLVEGVITSNATIVNLAKFNGVTTLAGLSAVKTLTVSAVTSAAFSLDAVSPGTLTTATVTGAAAAAALTNTIAVTSLKSLTVNGIFGTVSLTNAPAMTTVVTGGTINQFVLNNCDLVTATGLTLGHAYIAGSVGSDLVITNNALITTVKTSSDMLRTLTITGNPALVNLDLSSYTSVLFGGAINITINTNALTGAYTNAVPAGVLPYVETTLTGSGLTTLKPLIANWKAATTATVPTSTASLTYSINLDAVKIGSGAATLLSVKMAADTDHSPAFTSVVTLAGAGANAYKDYLAIVQ